MPKLELCAVGQRRFGLLFSGQLGGAKCHGRAIIRFPWCYTHSAAARIDERPHPIHKEKKEVIPIPRDARAVDTRAVDARTVLALTLTLLFWASAFAAIRAALKGYAPGHLALLRLLVASAVVAVCAVPTRIRVPDRRDLPAILLMGFLGFTVYHAALNYGEVSVTAGAASFLINTAPIFTSLLAITFLGERLNMWGWIGIAISFAGVATITAGEGSGLRLEPGALLVLLAAISASGYLVLQKRYLTKYGAFELTTYAMWAGTFFLLIFGQGLLSAIRTAPLSATLAAVYMGIFPTAVAYITWASVLSRLTASKTASFLYLVPAMAVAIAWLWLGEVPTWYSLVGGMLALAGVVLVNTRGR